MTLYQATVCPESKLKAEIAGLEACVLLGTAQQHLCDLKSILANRQRMTKAGKAEILYRNKGVA